MLPEKIKINNFFSHKSSTLDFTEFKSALLIGNVEGDFSKSNGSGKSAIFEAIYWCLFNKSRASKADDVVSWGEKTCNVSFVFRSAGNRFKVVRSRSRDRGMTTVDFFREEDDSWLNISGSTASLTNERIRETLRITPETFLNSVYFRQANISEFAESDASNKKDILKSIIDISKWDVYKDKIRSLLRSSKVEKEMLSKMIEDFDKNITRKNACSESLVKGKERLSALEIELESSEREISSYKEKYYTIRKSLDSDSYDKTVQIISSLEKDIVSFQSSRDEIFAKMSEKQDKCLKFNSTIQKIEDFLANNSFCNDIDDKISRSDSGLISLRSKRDMATSRLSDLKSRKFSDGSCYVCNQKISRELYDCLNEDNERKIKELRSIISQTSSEILALEVEKSDFESSKKTNSKILEAKSKMSSGKERVGIIKEAISRDSNDLNILDLKIAESKSSLSENLEILSSLKSNDYNNIKELIKEKESEKSSIVKNIYHINKKIGSLTAEIKMIDEKLEDSKKTIDKISLLNDNIKIYEKLSNMLGKRGIQSLLLNSLIEDLESTSNSILSTITDGEMSITLQTQREKADGSGVVETLDIIVNKSGLRQDFKSLSGGEQFRISLSLRIAMSEISSRHGGSKLEFLLLDEINSPLDRSGANVLFYNIIKSLEGKYKILVITHDDSIKEIFDNVIKITKINDVSYLDFERA